MCIVIKKVKNKKSHSESSEDSPFVLVLDAINIFHTLVIAYLFRAIVNWPNIIHDTETLNKLYAIILTKIVNIQSNLSQTLMSLEDRKGFSFLPMYIWFNRMCSHERLAEYLINFKKFNMEEELTHVLKELHLEQLYGSRDGKVFPS